VLIIIQPFHCIFEDCMLDIFTHAKRSFRIVQTMEDASMFMLVWSLALLSFFGFYLPNYYYLYVVCMCNGF